MGYPLSPSPSFTSVSPLARKNVLPLKGPDQESKGLFLPPQLLGCYGSLCETDAPLWTIKGRAVSEQVQASLSTVDPSAPCPHSPSGPASLGALPALAGLPSASAILDVCVNTHPRVKGTAHPFQGHRAKAKNPQLGVRKWQRHGHVQPQLCDLRKVAQPSGPLSFDRVGQKTLPGPGT